MIRKILSGFLVFSLLAIPAFAGVEQIVNDFRPLTAYVVMPVDGEYIIDKDASDDVKVGDIFAALQKGEPIIHPVTGEVLGTLDEVRARLRVSRIKSGYSYAIPLPDSAELKAGDAIVRFQGLPATFWDYTGGGESIYTMLKSGLPALDWSDYEAAQARKPERPGKVEGLEGLVFVLTGKGLNVRDATFQPIRFYGRADLAGEGVDIAAAPVARPVAAPESTTKAGIVTPTEKGSETPGIVIADQESTRQGVWRGPEMKGEIVGIEVVDTDGDGQKEILTAFPNKVLIGSLSGGAYRGQGFIDIPGTLRVFRIDAADLDGNGRPEYYITAAEKAPGELTEKLQSIVMEKTDSGFRIIDDDLPFFFNRVDLPGRGRVIVAQRAENYERTYSGKPYILEREGNNFKLSDEQPYDYHRLTVHGFAPFSTNNNTLVALLDINEKLEVITPSGDRMWKGGERMGGSQTYIVHPDPNVTSASSPMHHFLKARLESLDDGTVLVPLNEGSTRMFYKREFSESKIVAMQWDGFAMKEAWQTEPQGGYLADFRAADVDNDGREEIVMGVLFSQGGVVKEVQERSALVVYELP